MGDELLPVSVLDELCDWDLVAEVCWSIQWSKCLRSNDTRVCDFPLMGPITRVRACVVCVFLFVYVCVHVCALCVVFPPPQMYKLSAVEMAKEPGDRILCVLGRIATKDVA